MWQLPPSLHHGTIATWFERRLYKYVYKGAHVQADMKDGPASRDLAEILGWRGSPGQEALCSSKRY
jgi:hypothetical protein